MTANKEAAPTIIRRSSLKSSIKQPLKDKESDNNKTTDFKIEKTGKIHKNIRKSVKFAKPNLLEPATSKPTKSNKGDFSSQIANTSNSGIPIDDQSGYADARDPDTPLRTLSSSRLKLIDLQTAMGGEGPDADWFAQSRYMEEHELLREVIRRRAKLKIMSRLRIAELPSKDKEMFLSITDTMKHEVSSYGLSDQKQSQTVEWYSNTSSHSIPHTLQVDDSASADELKKGRLLLIKRDGTHDGATHIQIIPHSLLLLHKLAPDFKPVYNPNLLELSKEPKTIQTSKNNLFQSSQRSSLTDDFSVLLRITPAIHAEGHKSAIDTTYKRVIPTSSANTDKSNNARVTAYSKLQTSPEVLTCIYKSTPKFAECLNAAIPYSCVDAAKRAYVGIPSNAKDRTSGDTLKFAQLRENPEILQGTDEISGFNNAKNSYGIKIAKTPIGIPKRNPEINLKQVAPELINSRSESSHTVTITNMDIQNCLVPRSSTDSVASKVETVIQTTASMDHQSTIEEYMELKNQNDVAELRDAGNVTSADATANQNPPMKTRLTTEFNHSIRKSNLTVDAENVKPSTETVRKRSQ